MDEKKIKQQKLLAYILIGCSLVVLSAPLLERQVGKTTFIGLLFLIVGVITLKKVKQVEEQQKNNKA